MKTQSHGISHVGKVRTLNEDAMLYAPEKKLWVVADGMGGHSAGDVASRTIVERMGELPADAPPEVMLDRMEDALIETNTELQKMAREQESPTMIGSTVAALLLSGKCCYYAWAGDSRLYRSYHNKTVQMTTDHSQVEQYVEQGLITRHEALSHPHGNMITRAVGVTENFYLDMEMQPIQAGERFLLCSDGLNKHINDLEIEKMLRAGSPQQCCETLVETTLSRGAKDNVTVIVVDVVA